MLCFHGVTASQTCKWVQALPSEGWVQVSIWNTVHFSNSCRSDPSAPWARACPCLVIRELNVGRTGGKTLPWLPRAWALWENSILASDIKTLKEENDQSWDLLICYMGLRRRKFYIYSVKNFKLIKQEVSDVLKVSSVVPIYIYMTFIALYLHKWYNTTRKDKGEGIRTSELIPPRLFLAWIVSC